MGDEHLADGDEAAVQAARALGQELLEVSAVLCSIPAERTVVLVERLIEVADDAAHRAGIAPELERAARSPLAPAPVRRRVLTDLIDALRHDRPGTHSPRIRHLVVA